MSDVYTNLTKIYSNGYDPKILGREDIIKKLTLTMLRREKPNAVLIAEPGVGKTAVVHQFAYLIANKKVPKELFDFQIIEVNTNALLAGPGYRGVTEQKFQDMIDTALAKGKVILFMDEFHTVENLGQMANGQTPGLGNTLKPFLTRADFRVIGATTREEFSGIKDKALLRRFYPIRVMEPDDEAVKLIITSCLTEYGRGITFTTTTAQKILDLSKSMDGYNPDKAKDICDLLCSYCKMESIKKINDDDIGVFFNEYYKDNRKESKELFDMPVGRFVDDETDGKSRF